MNNSGVAYGYLPQGANFSLTGATMSSPSRWQVKQNWIGSSMAIKDEWGADIFDVENKIFSFGKQLNFVDKRTGVEVASVKEQIRLGMPKYSILIDGREIAEIKQKFKLGREEFSIELTDGEPMTVLGDLMDHSYKIQGRDGTIVAEVEKKWLTMRDTYTVEIQPGQNVIFILACCVVIDKCTTKD